MQRKYIASVSVLVIFIIFPSAFAEPSVHILMNQTIFSYGDKLLYVIEVNEVTGDSAIIHIRDDSGKESSAIPIQISELNTTVSSPFAFDKDVFPTGKYYIDVEYSGSEDTAEFNVIDSGRTVFPFWMKQVAYSWVNDDVSDGALIDAITKAIDADKLGITKNIKNDLDSIYIPKWMKTAAVWWLEEKISDDDFANAIQYLIKTGAITL